MREAAGLSKAARGAAAVTAVVGWAALALQLVLIADKLGPALGLWRFLGFFTVLTNIGAAAVATAMAHGRGGDGFSAMLASPRARLLAATSIAVVGITYSVALRALWNPSGWQWVADHALHDAMPLLFLLSWALAPHGGPHGRLTLRDGTWALVPPALYAGYALARGAADGWYAYWFLDPSTQGVAQLAMSVAMMLAGFAAVAALLVAADRWLGRRAQAVLTPINPG